MRKLFMGVALCLGVHAPAAFAKKGGDLREDLELLQEEQPTEVVSGPSKILQRRSEAPAAVTVITGEDLRRFGYRTVSEAVRGMAGLSVTNGRDVDYIGVRGVSLPGDFNTRILVTINGHTMNELWNNSSALGEDLGLDISLVEKIEVVLGPGSSVYGHGAFFATVHITTKTGADLNWARAFTEVGNFGHVRASATSGKELAPGFSYLVNAWVLRRSGEPLYFPEFAKTPTGGFAPEAADRTQAYGFFAELRLGDFTVFGKYHTREQGLAFAPFRTVFGDEQNALQEARAFAEGRYEKRWRPGGALREVELIARVYIDRYRYDDFLSYADGTPPLSPSYLFRDIGEANWYGAEVRTRFELPRTRLVLGTEYQEAFRIDSRSFIPSQYYTRPPLPGETKDIYLSTPFTMFAAYAQGELRLHDRVTLTTGLRFDHSSRFENAFSPRGGLILHTSADSRLKLLYGQAFRNPSVYEAFFDDGVDIAANPALKAERIQTAEIVYEHNLRKDLQIRAGFFFSQIQNLIRLQTVDIDPNPDVTTLRRQFQNTPGYTNITGGELRVSYRPRYGLLAYLSMALQRARYEGAELPSSPGILFSAGFNAPIIESRLYGGLELRAVGPRTATDLQSNVGAYAIVDLHLLTVQILDKLSISAKVYNLLDATYGEIPGIERVEVTTVPGARRTFLLRLDLDW
jgi:iron complex outermembrane receptor protein